MTSVIKLAEIILNRVKILSSVCLLKCERYNKIVLDELLPKNCRTLLIILSRFTHLRTMCENVTSEDILKNTVSGLSPFSLERKILERLNHPKIYISENIILKPCACFAFNFILLKSTLSTKHLLYWWVSVFNFVNFFFRIKWINYFRCNCF